MKVTIDSKEHKDRVKAELQKVGLSRYNLVKPTCRYLPRLIQVDETIGGAVVGRYDSGTAMLVASDQRIIFVDHKPLFTTSDEITYEFIAGVKLSQNGPWSGVTLHTRVRDYQLRYVNRSAAQIFVKYIEKRLIKGEPQADRVGRHFHQLGLNPAAKAFLSAHDTAVFSTVDRTGNVSGAVVYYLVDQDWRIFILTRSGTTKAQNVFGHSQAALTIYEADPPRTLQLEGESEHVVDQKLKDWVFSQMVKPRNYKSGSKLPPVTDLSQGSYVVIGFYPTSGRYNPYQAPRPD